MTDENVKVTETEDTTQCNCPVCKVLRSEETKKFLAVILASFIGCSLAILVFAPKRHHRMYRPLPQCRQFMDRPIPPAYQMHNFRRVERIAIPEFKGEHPAQRGELRNAPQHDRNIHNAQKKPDGKWQGRNKTRNLNERPTPAPEPQPITE